MITQIGKVFEKSLSVITSILYLLMIATVTIQIAARYISFITVPWTEEFTRLLFIYIMCLGAPLSLKYEEFVSVDILTMKWSTKARLFSSAIVFLLIAAYCMIIFYTGIPFAKVGLRSTSPIMRLPMVIHHSSISIAMFLCGIMAMSCFYKYIVLYRNTK